MAAPAAARLKRRAGVNATSGTTPMTSARLCERKPSSMAQSASPARCVSTKRQAEDARPKPVRPWPYGRPSSRASTDGQHQSICAGGPPEHGASASRRRSVSRSAKPSAAIQSAAAVPHPSPFTSCRAAAWRPPARSRSIWGAPSVHAAFSTPCAGSQRDPNGDWGDVWRSSPAMRARNPAMRRACLASASGPSGTARGDSPFRLGEEGQSPTLREHERGSGCEIRRRLADSGMGDGSAWSTGNALATLGPSRPGGAVDVLFMFYGASARRSRSKIERIGIKMFSL